jgi:DNA-directed RNA polymerase subunit RPC12/RpoP
VKLIQVKMMEELKKSVYIVTGTAHGKTVSARAEFVNINNKTEIIMQQRCSSKILIKTYINTSHPTSKESKQ